MVRKRDLTGNTTEENMKAIDECGTSEVMRGNEKDLYTRVSLEKII